MRDQFLLGAKSPKDTHRIESRIVRGIHIDARIAKVSNAPRGHTKILCHF